MYNERHTYNNSIESKEAEIVCGRKQFANNQVKLSAHTSESECVLS